MGPKKRVQKPEKQACNLEEGEILRDTFKREWRLGHPFAQGGFGLIYFASDLSGNNAFALKVEPKSNGPLFCEIHFYTKVCRTEAVESFRLSHNLSHLAIPPLVGHGVHTHVDMEYRFLVMHRYGLNLSKSLLTPLGFTCVALQLTYTLEFIHTHGFVHSDIKASNVVFHPKDPRRIYLIDYGQVTRYIAGGVHGKYAPKAKNCHDGTLEYTSTDAHEGASPSRRSDLEILAYNYIDWLCKGKLPWKTERNAKKVYEMKRAFKHNPIEFLQSVFPKNYIAILLQFLQQIFSLDYEEAPNYNEIRNSLNLLRRCLNSVEPFDGLICEKVDSEMLAAENNNCYGSIQNGFTGHGSNDADKTPGSHHSMKLRKRTSIESKNQVMCGEPYVCKKKMNTQSKSAAAQTSF